MSDLATYQNWIGPGFAHLDESWGDEQTWDELREGFLAAIGVTDSDLATPECRVLGILVERVDAMGEHHRRYALLAAEERTALVGTAFTQWQQEGGGAPAGAPESAEPEMQYVEGRGWLRFDPSTGEWGAVEGGESETGEAETGEAEAPADEAGAAQYVEGHGWMRYDPATGEWVQAEAPDGGHEQVPSAPPLPEGGQPSAQEREQAELEHEEVPPAPPVEVGASDPELAAAFAELPFDTQELFTEAVQEELAPVIAEVIGEIEGIEDLSPEDIQAAFEAAVAEAGLAGAAETN